jgi:hypothetical protein
MKSNRRLDVRFSIPLWWPSLPINWRIWLPSRGNVLFTVLVLSGLLWAGSAGAFPLGAPAAASTSTGTVAYQGRLADASGNPVTATVPMIFRLYNAASGGTPLWEEQWTGPSSVRVSDGLFNVMLGSLTAIPQSVVTGNSNLWLGITVNTDNEMQPRVQLGSVPFAVQALTVPDGSITAAKLSPDISLTPPDGSITTAKLADGAVTQAKAPSLIKSLSPSTRVEFGTGTWSGVWGQNGAVLLWYRDTGVTFTTPFSSPPAVFINTSNDSPDGWAKVKGITTTGFSATNLASVNLGPGPVTFSWMAIGQ